MDKDRIDWMWNNVSDVVPTKIGLYRVKIVKHINGITDVLVTRARWDGKTFRYEQPIFCPVDEIYWREYRPSEDELKRWKNISH